MRMLMLMMTVVTMMKMMVVMMMMTTMMMMPGQVAAAIAFLFKEADGGDGMNRCLDSKSRHSDSQIAQTSRCKKALERGWAGLEA